MKCSKHKQCEAYWDADGRLQHTARTGKKAKRESELQERREAALGTSDAGAPAPSPRPRGGRRRGAAKTTQAVTRTTTPATQTTDVTTTGS